MIIFRDFLTHLLSVRRKIVVRKSSPSNLGPSYLGMFFCKNRTRRSRVSDRVGSGLGLGVWVDLRPCLEPTIATGSCPHNCEE